MSRLPSTVLVTGGAGFIGSHLVRALAARGCRVTVLDDLSTGRAARLDAVRDRIRFVHGSILDESALADALRGIEVVHHHAAMVSVPQSVEKPVEYHQTNATGTLRVLLAAKAAGARRVIYAASSSAYGEDPQQPKRESMRATPVSPYAVSKYAGELYMSVFAAVYGLETISLRYFNVFGPEQDPKSQYGAAVPNIVAAVLRDRPPTIYDDGEQTRDFCYIQNVVHANLLAAGAPCCRGEAVNIACGQRVSVNQIVRTANELLGKNVKSVHAPPRPGDVRDSLADITLARQVLSYEPQVQFAEGMKRSIEWYKAHLA
jgi:UDP-glucose 4-epimerase